MNIPAATLLDVFRSYICSSLVDLSRAASKKVVAPIPMVAIVSILLV